MKNKKNAPKLPRFVVPKCMMSQVFMNKKQKSRLRRNIKIDFE